jgi:hypothetical protein
MGTTINNKKPMMNGNAKITPAVLFLFNFFFSIYQASRPVLPEIEKSCCLRSSFFLK